MTKFAATTMHFTINDGSERNLSTYITDLGGLPGEMELIEDTALGATGRTHTRGIWNSTISLSGMWDDTATSGPDAVLSGLVDDDTARAFIFGPKGSTAGFPKYSGNCKVRRYDITGSVGNMVTWTAELAVQGAVTVGTF